MIACFGHRRNRIFWSQAFYVAPWLFFFFFFSLHFLNQRSAVILFLLLFSPSCLSLSILGSIFFRHPLSSGRLLCFCLWQKHVIPLGPLYACPCSKPRSTANEETRFAFAQSIKIFHRPVCHVLVPSWKVPHPPYRLFSNSLVLDS